LLERDDKLFTDAGWEPELRRQPELIRGTSKYSGYTSSKVGWFRTTSFPGLSTLPARMQKAVVAACNNSVSTGTWKTYGAVKTHLLKCQRTIGHRFTFPMSESSVVMFVAYLLSTNRLQAASIENVLSALSMYHLTEGYYVPTLRPDVLKHLLAGRGNEDAFQARMKPGRLPVTLKVMELIRLSLRLDEKKSEKEKSLIWAVCTMAFSQGFRAGELLSKRARSIDPDYDLQKKDIRHVTRVVGGQPRQLLVVTLKCPKETKQNKTPIKVEVFSNNTRYCAVKAYIDYTEKVGVKCETSAAFRVPNSGNAYRHQRFNLDLKRMLQPLLDYGSISGHSFRAGRVIYSYLRGISCSGQDLRFYEPKMGQNSDFGKNIDPCVRYGHDDGPSRI